MLDQNYPIETPEGVWLHLNIAGPVARGFALIIDLLIYAGLMFVMSIFGAMLAEFLGDSIASGVILILVFLFTWFYFVVFEMFNRGRTIGKLVMGLQVICDDGTPLTWKASLLRNLMRVVDFMPVLYALGFVSCMWSRRFKRLGDLAAGTLVIYAEPPAKPAAEFEVSKPHPPETAYSIEEQRGIVAFAERARYLGQARAEELANHLEPVLHKRDEDAVHSLLQQAAWLMGRRP